MQINHENLHIIDVARIGHLLDVDTGCWLNSRQYKAHSSLHQVLDVHKSAPHVAHVIKRVSCWARIPKSSEMGQNV